jgi:hypothetical protein
VPVAIEPHGQPVLWHMALFASMACVRWPGSKGQGVRLACPAGGGRLYGMPDWKLVHTLHAAAAWPTLSFLEFWDVLGSSFISSTYHASITPAMDMDVQP